MMLYTRKQVLDESGYENERSKCPSGERWWSISTRRAVVLASIVSLRISSRHGVEVEAEEQVGLGDGAHGIARGIVLEDHDLADTRHPVEKIGVFVRDDARHLVSHSPQHPGPCERRPHGIAVGIGMGDNHDLTVCRGEKFPEGFDTLFR